MTKPLQHIEPRFNHYAALRFATLASMTAGLGTLVALLSLAVFAPAIETPPKQAAAAVEDDELIATLRTLRATWEPRARRRVIDDAASRSRFIAGPLDRLLRAGEHSWHLEAAELAGALGDPALRPTLVGLASSPDPKLRSQVVVSAELLGPWTTVELDEFLSAEDLAVRLAALQVCADRADAPWERVVELLLGDDADLRSAAAAAFGDATPVAALLPLWEVLDLGEPEDLRVALAVLSRVAVDAASVRHLTSPLRHGDPSVRWAAIEVLARHRGSQPAADLVTSVLDDLSAPSGLRAHALHALERIGAFDADKISERLFFLDPRCRYFAARCLFAAGRSQAFDVLTELVDAEDAVASSASRQLLAWMTGRGATLTRGEFEDILGDGRVRPGARALPEPSIELVADENW